MSLFSLSEFILLHFTFIDFPFFLKGFHVWNEMWISKRSDIKPHGVHSPNGWQAVDATPQELSDDQNQMVCK